MNNFRSVCIVYQKADAYPACFLKEYFKWIGLSYVDELYNAETGIFQDPEKCMFDIIVNINGVLPENEEKRLKEILPANFIELHISISDDLKEKLMILLTQILITFSDLAVGKRNLLTDLAEIYNKYHMVSALYEYTFVLLEKMPVEICERFCEKYLSALQDVTDVLNLYRKENSGCTLKEYALYAKYNCQKSINELLLIQGKAPRYNVEEFLDNCNEIYAFDEKMYKVDYLKAKVAEQDCRYNALPRFFLEYCIEQCPVDICRSFQYYTMGKWREKNKQPYEAAKAYRLSYHNYPSNIKALFKLAVEKKEMNNPELAMLFLQQIMDIWTDEDNIGFMPPREIEYAFKTRLMMSELADPQLRGSYIDQAKKYSEFIRRLLDQPEMAEPSCFIYRLYPEQDERNAICSAMLIRTDLRCFQ